MSARKIAPRIVSSAWPRSSATSTCRERKKTTTSAAIEPSACTQSARPSCTARRSEARKPVPSSTAAGTDRPTKDRYTAAMSANHVNTSDAGSSTTVPMAVATASVRASGRTLPATAHAYAKAKARNGAHAMKSAMRTPPPRPRSSWSSTAIGRPSGSARQKLSP
jgi:hypothetical protein